MDNGKDKNWHKFRMDDLMILLDVNSGSLHVIDEIMWEVLDVWDPEDPKGSTVVLRDRYPEEAINECLDEINELKNEGVFDCRDGVKEAYKPEGGVVKALCLNVAHECDLRCKYCFAGTGGFGGERGLMPPEVGREAVRFLLENSDGRRHLEIDFFGGEPLLNVGTIEEVVRYGEEEATRAGKELRFTITTNGVLLDDKVAAFLSAHNIRAVLSLDGRPAVNDRMRHFPDGRGTYDVIMPHIRKFVEEHEDLYYSVRGTYTRYNLDFTEDVRHLVELGFNKVSVEPVVGGQEDDYALREEDVPRLEEEYERLARFCLTSMEGGKPFSFFHFNIDLDGGPCLPKRLSGCGAGNEYLAVTPKGDLYPCHQFVGREGFLLGDVFSGIKRPEICERFREAYVYNKPKCAGCWARFYCGGGCHANAHLINGDIFTPYEIGCALMKKRIECALFIKAKMLLDRSSS